MSKYPESKKYLDRLHEGNFVPKEKKELVVDLKKSKGPYLVSVDDNPKVIFDSASQIASLSDGYSADAFYRALDDGEFDESLFDADYVDESSIEEYKNFLIGQTKADKLKYISFTRGGAEANEKALNLARKLNKHGPRKIIAFEGSFHGRTTLCMHSTYNPAKRKGFEIDGYETLFAKFPEWKTPNLENSDSSEELKQEEDRSLEQVENFILENPNNICSVIIEPMLCEGGDRYASKRFFKKLRLLTKEYSIPLIFDEVQTGFGLGGDFFWHTHFDLESPPDFVTVAKRAQTGVVLSCVADSEPAQPHMINVQRGFIQAKLISQTDSRPIENLAAKYLENLQEEFSDQVFYPRHRGYAFAFDMPDTKSAMDLLAKRFELGFMAYIAGEKTLRFRLNMSTSEKEIKKLFEGLKAGLKNQPVVALDPALKADSCLRNDVRVVRLDKNNWQQYRDRIESIENKAYESGRRDSIEYLFDLATCENGLGLGLLDDKENLVGYAFGCPLEKINQISPQLDGPRQDNNLNKQNTFYAADLTLDENSRGRGLGKYLKQEFIKFVKENKSQNFEFVTGRNKVGEADSMIRLNSDLGAYDVAVYDKQYGQNDNPDSKALYYRIALRRDEKYGDFVNPVGTKLTLSNWTTPFIVKYFEKLRDICPEFLNHAYTTSGEDELVDKSLRSLKFHNSKAKFVLGLKNQFFGQITAAARSLTTGLEDDGHKWFDWPLLNNIGELEDNISKLNSKQIFGVYLDLENQKLDFESLKLAREVCDKHGLALVFKGDYLEFLEKYKQNSQAVKPDLFLWWTGGQLGHIFVNDKYYVEKPLTLISTWDGDEISMVRNYERIKAYIK